LRTIGSEICDAACDRTGKRSFSTGERSHVLCRTSAPMRRPPPSSAISSRPPIRLMSTRVPGAAKRSFMSGIRLWPPASTFASSPRCASSASASSSVSGAE
jgi:hypothetical protein